MLCSPCHPFQSKVISFYQTQNSLMWCEVDKEVCVRKVSERRETVQIEKHNLIIIIYVFCEFYLLEMFLITSSSGIKSRICSRAQEYLKSKSNISRSSTLNSLRFTMFERYKISLRLVRSSSGAFDSKIYEKFKKYVWDAEKLLLYAIEMKGVVKYSNEDTKHKTLSRLFSSSWYHVLKFGEVEIAKVEKFRVFPCRLHRRLWKFVVIIMKILLVKFFS